MKTLIVYYSHTNNNRLLALRLQKQLQADILRVEEFGKRTGFTILLDMMFNRTPTIKFSPQSTSGYDMIVVVAPIWAGKIASPMRAFLETERSSIKKYAFMTLCGGGAAEQVDRIRESLTKILKFQPVKISQVSINDLLPLDQRNKIKYTSRYRVNESDLNALNDKINEFVREVEGADSIMKVSV